MINKILILLIILLISYILYKIFYLPIVKIEYMTNTYNKLFPIHISEIQLDDNLQMEKNYPLIIKSAPRVLSRAETEYLLRYKKFVDLPNVYSMCEPAEINQIQLLLENIINDNITGCIVEMGVWRGGMSMWMQSILRYYRDKRDIWLFDTFGRFPTSSDSKDQYIHSITQMLFENSPTITDVKNNFMTNGLLDSNIKFVAGDIKDTVPVSPIQNIALLHCDTDYYDSTKTILENFYSRIVLGGYIVIDDYNNDFLGCKTAVDEFRNKYGIQTPIVDTHAGSVYWRL
jgi:hypothetical protein